MAGIYSEYLNRGLSIEQLAQARKEQLRRISAARNGNAILSYAADHTETRVSTMISYGDLVLVRDQLAELKGDALDIILETPGGVAEVAEDIVRLLRAKFKRVSVIVPGWSKSAGTIMAMAADEILMSVGSALGPIDAQLTWQGKVFSAEALLEGVEKIKAEALTPPGLNRAYIPILQQLSPGELERARNALAFARQLVRDWLVAYKFRQWSQHSTTGAPVTPAERTATAELIAAELCKHSRWLTHSRSITIDDLRGLGVRITDYGESPELHDAITRYHTLLRMTFSSHVYKVVETIDSQIYQMAPQPADASPASKKPLKFKAKCAGCKIDLDVFMPFEAGAITPPALLRFPADNVLVCPTCGAKTDLSAIRLQVESQANARIQP